MNRLAPALLVCAVAAFAIITLVGAEDDTARPKAAKASKLAEAWWYPGDGVNRKGKDQSSQKTGAGHETGEFFAYTGTVVNLGTYKNAWDYYAAKCGADEKHGDQPQIVAKPTKTGGYYTIFQRTDGGRHVTMFARHEEDSTVTVHLHEVESTADKTRLQISIVVVCHLQSVRVPNNRNRPPMPFLTAVLGSRASQGQKVARVGGRAWHGQSI